MHRQNHIFPNQFADALFNWYDRYRRRLPWRAAPGEKPDPYRVWLSEIMLQQTTIAAVGPYFQKFVTRWPDIEALAKASLDDILRAWAGLGYYARARNLHLCAKTLCTTYGGRFPTEAQELKKLPGIGSYTAGAIAAIAFDKPEVAIDGNVERVIARFFAIEAPLPDAKAEIKARARQLLPQTRAGDFAQALMDLGATICTPRSPNCLICPCTSACEGHNRGLAGSLPRRKPKQQRPVRYGTAFWIERRDGAVLLRRRPERGLLGGMMEVPSTAWTAEPSEAEAAPPLRATWKKHVGCIEHTFTHFHLILDIWRSIRIESGELRSDGDYRWVKPAQLKDEALPSVMRKVVAVVRR
ncbi:MAG TPA: A/G-specific adenine glycosylase [Aestuariivirgaceae bacterium]|nr:A/G-specific adenine glycosylase [Aestuariivirgaceae bacterium]